MTNIDQYGVHQSISQYQSEKVYIIKKKYEKTYFSSSRYLQEMCMMQLPVEQATCAIFQISPRVERMQITGLSECYGTLKRFIIYNGWMDDLNDNFKQFNNYI